MVRSRLYFPFTRIMTHDSHNLGIDPSLVPSLRNAGSPSLPTFRILPARDHYNLATPIIVMRPRIYIARTTDSPPPSLSALDDLIDRGSNYCMRCDGMGFTHRCQMAMAKFLDHMLLALRGYVTPPPPLHPGVIHGKEEI